MSISPRRTSLSPQLICDKLNQVPMNSQGDTFAKDDSMPMV